MATVLYVLADTIRQLAILTQPFMPDASAKLLDQLGIGDEERAIASLSLRLTPGSALLAPQGVFPRFQEDD